MKGCHVIIEKTPPFLKCGVKDCVFEATFAQNVAEPDHDFEGLEEYRKGFPKVPFCAKHHEEWHRLMYQEP